jgi:MSHA pilin protein MshA
MNQSRGFTLIELITVIAILGALAVIALPRFINLQDEAQQAAVAGVAGSLGAGAAINLAGALAGDAAHTSVVDCDDVPLTLAEGALPTGYSIASGSLGAATGDTASCTLTGPGSFTATFTGYYVP